MVVFLSMEQKNSSDLDTQGDWEKVWLVLENNSEREGRTVREWREVSHTEAKQGDNMEENIEKWLLALWGAEKWETM